MRSVIIALVTLIVAVWLLERIIEIIVPLSVIGVIVFIVVRLVKDGKL